MRASASVSRRDGSAALTEETEAVLAGDEKSRVRRSLASNPACSAETLDLLSSDEDQSVRLAVAGHRSTPREALAGMAQELDRRRDLSIARALARNPRTPRAALEEWLDGGTEGQRTPCAGCAAEAGRSGCWSGCGGGARRGRACGDARG